ncbi:MAG: flagellar basal-body MS-ring/collar protein FliF [Anaerolineae bacterium]
MPVSTERIRVWWSELATWQQIALGALAVTGLAFLIYLSASMQAPQYAALYTDLSEQDAAEIVDILRKENIPYRVDETGSVISVPSSRVAEVRLDLAKQGLPRGGTVGFEIFDGGQLGSLGMTDFVQKINYQRALEGELARTIASLDPLAGARVHIAIPEPSLFVEEERPPTASVFVQLKPGRMLDRGQIDAITYLVSSSVDGLKPENVTIVDAEGRVLWNGSEQSTDLDAQAARATQLEVQRRYEQDLEQRLQRVLDQALGPGRSTVQVSVVMDWDRVEVTSETYEPQSTDTGVVRSSRVVEEVTQEQPGSTVGGVPGVDANASEAPTYAGVEETTETVTGSGIVRREQVYNYEVSRTVQSVVKAPGTVKRLSVAVLLDDSLPAELQSSIEDTVAAAVGLDPSRGDKLAVAAVPFEGSTLLAEQQALEGAQRGQLYVAIARAMASIIGLILLLLFVRGLFRDLSRRYAPAPSMALIPAAEAVTSASLAAIEAAQARLPPGSAMAALESGEASEESAPIHPDAEEVEDEIDISMLRRNQPEDARYLRRVAMLAREDPDALAEVIRTWLREG